MKTTKDTKRGTAKRPAAKKTKATARTVAKSGETAREEPPALAYSDADAAYIRKAFEDALEIHARLVYDTMEEAERVRVIKLDDSGAYPIYGGMSAIADAAQFHADRFKRGITGEKWKAASRKAFQKRITDRAVLSVEEFDPVRKMSRLTNAEGVTSEVNTDKPLTHSRPKSAYERREWEQRGDVYVFTRWRTPSVSAREVKLYGWRSLVEAAGLVLIGRGDDARYYTPGEVAAVKAKRAIRKAKAAEYEAEAAKREAEREEKRKREAAAREEERAAAEVGRAVMAYGKLAGTVAPSPSAASAPVAIQPEEKKPRKCGRPPNPNGRRGYRPSPDRLAVFIAIMEEYRRDPGAKWAEAVAACEKRDGKLYDWYAIDKNATRWATYNHTDRTTLRGLPAADWEKQKAKLK